MFLLAPPSRDNGQTKRIASQAGKFRKRSPRGGSGDADFSNIHSADARSERGTGHARGNLASIASILREKCEYSVRFRPSSIPNYSLTVATHGWPTIAFNTSYLAQFPKICSLWNFIQIQGISLVVISRMLGALEESSFFHEKFQLNR